jgi:hypothetical protein
VAKLLAYNGFVLLFSFFLLLETKPPLPMSIFSLLLILEMQADLFLIWDDVGVLGYLGASAWDLYGYTEAAFYPRDLF